MGVNIQKEKHTDFHLKKYEKLGKMMPAVAVVSGDPLDFLVGSTMVSIGTDEYDLAGALRGEPTE